MWKALLVTSFVMVTSTFTSTTELGHVFLPNSAVSMRLDINQYLLLVHRTFTRSIARNVVQHQNEARALCPRYHIVKTSQRQPPAYSRFSSNNASESSQTTQGHAQGKDFESLARVASGNVPPNAAGATQVVSESSTGSQRR